MIRALLICAGAGAVTLSLATMAQPLTIDLPIGDTPMELAGPDAEVVVNNCSSCHSLDYITTQPRGKGEQFWRDAVAKMITVYKAPITPDDAEAVSTILAHKFG